MKSSWVSRTRNTFQCLPIVGNEGEYLRLLSLFHQSWLWVQIRRGVPISVWLLPAERGLSHGARTWAVTYTWDQIDWRRAVLHCSCELAWDRAVICSCKNLWNGLIMHGRNRSTMIMRAKGDTRAMAHGGNNGQNEAELPCKCIVLVCRPERGGSCGGGLLWGRCN